MLWLAELLLGALLFHPASAIHASEAGVVDWYKPLVGDALTGKPNLSPVFHRIEDPQGSTRSLVLAATASNVLAALHPENGTIAWRHLFEAEDRILAFKKQNNLVASISGAGGATLRILDVSTGHLLHEQQLHKPEAGTLLEPDDTGIALAFNASTDLYALTDGHIVRRVSTVSGEVVWGWAAPGQSSLNIYSAVVPTSTAVYLVGLAKSFASYTLHVTALSPIDGAVLATADVPSSIDQGPSSFFVISKGDHCRVVWLEAGQVRSVGLAPDLKEKPTNVKGAVYHEIIDVGLGDHGMFVALKEDGSGRLMRLNDAGLGLKVIWEFADSHSPSIYSGGVDKDGYPYVSRVFWSHSYKKASAHILAPHLAEGKGLVTGYTFPFNTGSDGIIGDVALDAANPEEFRVLGRLVLATTTGALQLWQHDQLQWTREEGLADVKLAEFVELPERKLAETHVGEDETFAQRVRRQLAEARGFPAYAASFARRFVTGSYETVSASAAPANDSAPLVRDAFGFRKVLVVVTARGKVYGLDSASGDVLWSRVFGLGWAAEVGARIVPLKIFTLRTVGDGETPQVVIVAQRKANNGLLDTVLFHVDALTGEDSTGASPYTDVLQGIDIIAGPLVETYFLHDESAKFVILFDEFLQARLSMIANVYPNTPANTAAFNRLLPSLHFALRTGSTGSLRLTGHQLGQEAEFTGKHVAHPTWTASLPAGEDIVALVARPQGPVASLGKVLGDRTTLYKYLNPNLIGVLTATLGGPAPTCGVYVVDVVKGSTLYHSVLPAASGRCDVKAAFVENWLVYHYYDDEAGREQAKGYRVVSVEFYEGQGADDKTGSSALSSYSNASTSVHTYEQSYVFPRGVTAITTTATKFGITSKDIIVAAENGIIQAFPRRFVDPRRPKRKPTNEEAEEWLVQYDALTPDDPKRVLSHAYRVHGVRGLLASPALLESTSLVFAHGLDLFASRVAPSGTFDVLSESFNKPQLVVTLAALALAIVITKPMVARKKLRERWYN
ncbi:hypothetical protein PHLGIDRAFT_62449 [Phlebiopsis gigantea 11061_1 CR5-6]|uniref:ER membrane protein complex subunit 1 n=1 Tax=Phlebiopsis gigantea (strain 11061_1 CR5-6) TaxID=745531 RepID=A0A0C3SFJ5_PHLG1|nr:hypothetical protein PHLGIDRAFT_62449 [Phlebiopsis gigantea 11061_1 CR5-6]